MKTIKNFFRSTWSKFIVNQFNKVDLEFKEKTIIESFRKLQIDSLSLKNEIVKYKKKRNGGSMIGKFYNVITHFKSDNKAFVHSKQVNCKNNQIISQTFLPSIINS